MKVVALVQARMGSSRLPNKVMKPINGQPLIEILLARLSKSKSIHEIVLATSVNAENLVLIDRVKSLGFSYYQGSEDDVMGRFVGAADAFRADVIVRITADCPLVDPELVDHCVDQFKRSRVDYVSNNHPPLLPDGLDVEVVDVKALVRASKLAVLKHDREHVTPFILNSSEFVCLEVRHDQNLSELRWTVDEPEDWEVIENVFDHFAPDIHFGWKEVLRLNQEMPELFSPNNKIERNEGERLGKGQKLWKRSKRVIPGGNMLLSKRSEMFLPDHWPSYYSKASGCSVWDLDGQHYFDLSIMGIGTNSLGYGHEAVDAAVMRTIASGNMSTLNCPEEVALAEKLIEMHPWSSMVKFTRSGGEANAVAVRIARAASGKDNVAVCGYHGWHDWYLATNLESNDKLAGHLLPGLVPNGVPKGLQGTVFPFEYNDIDRLKTLVKSTDIGTIKMEVLRNTQPENNFLQQVRQLASDNGIVLIFDECTSGFRESFGGIHKNYGVYPDMAMFGKALGNGYAINAVIGRPEIMDAAQTSFISSTFWTERIGPSAALATLEVMENTQSWKDITEKGKKIKTRWQSLADQNGLTIHQTGIPALASFSFSSEKHLSYKTYLTQEMLKSGFLASNSIYVCTAHTEEIIEEYFTLLEPLFKVIRDCEDGRDIADLLDGPICHSGFRRLN